MAAGAGSDPSQHSGGDGHRRLLRQRRQSRRDSAAHRRFCAGSGHRDPEFPRRSGHFPSPAAGGYGPGQSILLGRPVRHGGAGVRHADGTAGGDGGAAAAMAALLRRRGDAVRGGGGAYPRMHRPAGQPHGHAGGHGRVSGDDDPGRVAGLEFPADLAQGSLFQPGDLRL